MDIVGSFLFIFTSNITFIFTLALGFVAFKRLLTYLHILQQDDYDTKRFLKWFFKNRAYDRYMTTTIVFCILGSWAFGLPTNFANTLFFALTIVLLIAYREKRPTKDAKKSLIMTTRAKRIFCTSYILLLPIICQPLFGNMSLYTLILSIQAIPFVLALGNLVTLPVENLIQRHYLAVAQKHLTKTNPIIIGITGSYGKTSMKHILGHILTKHQPTLFTPGSINTPMGICTIISQKLKAFHKYFIVEMGAYQRGSIAHICQLTPPNMGIVTSIGPCHLERFGSIENIAYGKSELLAAVDKSDNKLGFCFPKDVANYAAFKSFAASKDMIRPLQCLNPKQTVTGISLQLKEKDTTTTINAPIYGLHQASNIVLAATVARHLGVPMEIIKSALTTLPQIYARLEVTSDADNVTWINDAYNSNPEGFKQALLLLDLFGKHKKSRKILVTPGVIELGDQHDTVHAALARQTMNVVDVLIIVSPQRIPSFVSTTDLLKRQDQQVLHTNTFDEAKTWLDKHMSSGDSILLANDLPDILESRPNI